MDVKDVEKVAGEVYDFLIPYLQAIEMLDDSEEFIKSGTHSIDFSKFLEEIGQGITQEIKKVCRVGGDMKNFQIVVNGYRVEMTSFTAAAAAAARLIKVSIRIIANVLNNKEVGITMTRIIENNL